MSLNGWLQIAVFIGAVLLLARPMGLYLTRIFERRRTWLDPVLVPCERLLYRLTRVDAAHEMRWTEYTLAMLVFSAATILLTYAIERLQGILPLNPQHLPAVEPILALNTAISFTTNTNWQSYTPETTMSYLTQMLGLATHNFWSAAVGIALAIAFIRGITRREMNVLGNFWVDLTCATLWVLLPICLVYSVALISQGVVQNLRPYDTAALLETQRVTGADGKTTTVSTQTIAQGPVASQEAIKMLGTNGGGFFNVPPDAFDLPHTLRARHHARRDDRLAKTWLGRARRNGGALVRRRLHLLLGRIPTQPTPPRSRPARLASAIRRQYGRQRGPLRHRQLRALRDRYHRRQLRRRQLDA